MGMGILETAVTGLIAFQKTLATTSHNIANVNTEGYSRQRVELATMPETFIGSPGFIGNGVSVENITRSYDQFISTQLRTSTSAFNDADRYRSLASQVDNILADPTTGMTPALKDFFNAVNELADDPSSIPARQVLLSEAQIMTQRFGTMQQRFVEMREQVNQDIIVAVEDINSYSSLIAEINVKIATEQGRTGGIQMPNDLLDERDRLIAKLSELVDVSVIPSNHGMVNVVIGQGQSLVLDGNANSFVVQNADHDPTHLEIGMNIPGGTIQMITHQLSGGSLTGAMRFRDEMLDPAQQTLGAIAASVALEFNAVHAAGFDLQGNTGQLFFGGINDVAVVADPAAVGAITAVYDASNISALDSSDYRLDVGAGAYTLTRLNDNSSISLTDVAGVLTPTAPDELPGIVLTLDVPAPVDGDSFIIRPTYFAAQNIETLISDPDEIAAATNLDVDGVTVIDGAMPGDNRNALLLAELENKLGMLGGNATFNDVYGQMISEIATLSHAANVSASAQETLLVNAKESWAEVSGVNLDEEAANLVKFQQSYQAAAQVISVTNTLFDSLLAGLR